MPVTVPPETVALVRRLYADDLPTRLIQQQTGVTSSATFYGCLDGRFDDGSGAPLPPLPRRREGLRIVRNPARRKSLIARIWKNAEAQVEKIEARLAQHEFTPKVVERDARALAVLVRTLRELSAFADMRKPAVTRQQKPEPEHEDVPPQDHPPQDLDEFRNELARRMRAFVEERTGGGVPGRSEE